VDTRKSALYQDLKSGIAPAGVEYYLPLFYEHTATLFDYVGDKALPVLADAALANGDAFWLQAQARYEQRRHDVEHPVLPPEELYLAPNPLREALNSLPRIELCGPAHPRFAESTPLGDVTLPPLPLAPRDAPAGQALRQFLDGYPG